MILFYFFVCVCVHKPVLLQAKNIAMLLCLCVCVKRERMKKEAKPEYLGRHQSTDKRKRVSERRRERKRE